MTDIKEYEQYLMKKGRLIKIVPVNTGRWYIFRIKDERIPGGLAWT